LSGPGKERSIRSRLGLAFLIAVASCLVFTASSSACQIANLQLDDSAGPGDTVSYSISGIEPTSSYSFTIAGKEISGTNTTGNPGVSGTFTMPDLGSQQLTLTAHGTCTCPQDANSQNLVDSMQYLPPPPPPAATTTTAKTADAPTTQVSRARHHRPSLPVAVAKPVAREQKRQGGSPTGLAAGSAPSNSVGSEPGPSNPSSGSGEARRPGTQSSSVPDGVLNAIGSTTSVGPADIPTVGLLLIALIFIAGTGLAAVVIYILRRGPDPEAAIKAPAPIDPDPVEAELQEMIADEMARQLLSDLDLGEPTVRSR
jgi:hypothetical protein